MIQGALGKTYCDGEVVCAQGEVGDCLYVIQDGQLEIIVEQDSRPTVVRVAGRGELIGEMAFFLREVRSATVRARGSARVLTLDRKNFLRRINEDPSLAFRMVETMSRRVRDLSRQVVDLRRQLQARGTDA